MEFFFSKSKISYDAQSNQKTEAFLKSKISYGAQSNQTIESPANSRKMFRRPETIRSPSHTPRNRQRVILDLSCSEARTEFVFRARLCGCWLSVKNLWHESVSEGTPNAKKTVFNISTSSPWSLSWMELFTVSVSRIERILFRSHTQMSSPTWNIRRVNTKWWSLHHLSIFCGMSTVVQWPWPSSIASFAIFSNTWIRTRRYRNCWNVTRWPMALTTLRTKDT